MHPAETAGQWRQIGTVELGRLQAEHGYVVALTNVDYRATLWVDGRPIVATTDEQYQADYEQLTARLARAAAAPIPQPDVRITAEGGPCRLRHINLCRDVYYTNQKVAGMAGPGDKDFPKYEYALTKLNIESGQRGWGTTGNPIRLRDYEDDDLDEFFVLGDNSPQSLDGRSWTAAAPTLRLYDEQGDPLYHLGTVPRYNLLGKALFVYWPAGYRVPGLPNLPLLPNVGKMRLIR
jgi:signal peptidase I